MSAGSLFLKAMNPQLMNRGQLESLAVLRILIVVSNSSPFFLCFIISWICNFFFFGSTKLRYG